MKKTLSLCFVFLILTTIARAWSPVRYTPEVRYISPKDEEVVGLEGKENLSFRWKPTPRPGGGRQSYRFELFKGYGYERLVNETLDPEIVIVDVPAEIFEKGATYTWQVRQRDSDTMIWSYEKRWSFRIEK